ncbi:diacylglycerol kinase family protein [Ekhidna sp.]|jgi:diacylglycerol kinase (ATP)|uniref:diacylglycerol/lipid kinase family protein n=1 Tax=Ekhidna sp. TaxID=2608089 RepID=UPI0032EDB743
MSRKIFVIWNPFAGGKALKICKKLSEALNALQIDYQVFDTNESKSATTTIEEFLDTSFTDLIIIGGDGTINESVNGLKYDIPVSILPAGTGDDFIKNVLIGKTLEEQIDTAINGEIKRIDLGQCNDRKFVNGVGIGFDGQIVEDMASKRVPLLTGHAAYYYHVLRILGGYKERRFDYQIGDQSFQKDLILLTIGNGTTFGGGFKLMPEAKIDDGLLEICEIGKVSGLRRFLNINKLSGGTHGSLREINFYKAKSVKVEANELLFAHIDGERMGQPPFELKILPKAMQLRVKM